MDALDIARWQFGITTVYHFLFVPITIGLSAIVAGYETAWVRTGNEQLAAADQVLRQALPDQLRHRRGHRHRAGVPVRHELERLLPLRRRHLRRPAGDRGAARVLPRVDLPRPVDLRLGPAARRGCTPACIWLVHIGTLFSAYFILAANSWMQHPVGYAYNPDTGRAELHRLRRRAAQQGRSWSPSRTPCSRPYLTGGAFVVGVAVLAAGPQPRRRRRPRDVPPRRCASAPRSSLVAGLGVAVTGDIQGKIMTEVQPMKMAAAEALYDTESPRRFSLFTIGSLDGSRRSSRSRSRACCRSSATGTLRRRGRGHQRAARAVPADVRPGPGCGLLLARRLHARSSRSPTGPSG